MSFTIPPLTVAAAALTQVQLLLLLMVVVAAEASHALSVVRGVGQWTLLHSSIGISAMHMQLLHNNKVVIFDRTDFGPSNISLPNHRCREDPSDTALQVDCTAHSVLYDIPTNTLRPLTLLTDVWCSSAAVLSDGTFLQTGGFNDGDRSVRTFTPCGHPDDCDWVELPSYLSRRRWYATNQVLPQGHVIILGGRRQFNYEYYPKVEGDIHPLRFLSETKDSFENNLYPFLHLLPDGNLFVFANTRSILLDYKNNLVVKEFPPLPGGDPRNYPSSGSSVLLPIDENEHPHGGAEIMICGGAPNGSARDALHQRFLPALSTCGRIKVSDQNPRWVMETMPIPRVMGDMLLLPTGDVIIINGAGEGTAGWERGRRPVTQPVIYNPSTREFSRMRGSPRPRMYHSSAILMPDASILVGGSNPHVYYNFTGVTFPTDLSLEAYSPPYLDPDYSPFKPTLVSSSTNQLGYNQPFVVSFSVPRLSPTAPVSVTLLAPSFTTHSFGMNQRCVVLRMVGGVRGDGSSATYSLNLVGPSAPEVAPPGYYLLFVVHAGIPSTGAWVRVVLPH